MKFSIYNLITMPLIFIDGLFHLFSVPEVILTKAPDWILYQGIFELTGLPVPLHRVIGIFLVLSTLFVFYSKFKKRDNKFIKVYERLIVPVTLFIISSAIIYSKFIL